ncbi:MAG: hypothetical protein ACK443_08320 [Methylococcaceae bacterium]|jgi:hypothetical protein
MTSALGTPLFFTYRNGEFQPADVSRYFGGKAKTTDDIVNTIKNEDYESMTREQVDAGEVSFSLWEGPGHQCVVQITSKGVPPHIIYLDGLLNWLQFQGAILNPALQMARMVHGDA